MILPENFVAYFDVLEACPYDQDSVDAKEVVGRMTGLDMTKYDLVLAVDLCGWHIVKIP